MGQRLGEEAGEEFEEQVEGCVEEGAAEAGEVEGRQGLGKGDAARCGRGRSLGPEESAEFGEELFGAGDCVDVGVWVDGWTRVADFAGGVDEPVAGAIQSGGGTGKGSGEATCIVTVGGSGLVSNVKVTLDAIEAAFGVLDCGFGVAEVGVHRSEEQDFITAFAFRLCELASRLSVLNVEQLVI